jgi:hypothetical protein
MSVQRGRDGAIAIVTASGQYEMSELRDGVDSALAAFGSDGASGLLVDLSDSQVMPDRSSQDLQTMAYFLVSRAQQFARRLAMVASTDLAFGMMRMGTVVVESQGVAARVFRDRAAAMTWLVPSSA